MPEVVTPPRRRCPHLPLPSTTFVAGLSPRPAPGWCDDVAAAECFAFGCDLFDAGCYFEAHELWERCWLASRAAGDVDDTTFVQGLIKLAAAGVKWLAGMEAPMHSHLHAASRLLASTASRRGLSREVIDGAIAALARGERPRLDP